MPRPSRYAPDTLARPAHWDREAACRRAKDPDCFFPDGDEGLVVMLTREAKSYCHRCPVLDHCQADALARPEPHGVWGGLTADERRSLLRRAAEEAAAEAKSTEPADAAPAA